MVYILLVRCKVPQYFSTTAIGRRSGRVSRPGGPAARVAAFDKACDEHDAKNKNRRQKGGVSDIPDTVPVNPLAPAPRAQRQRPSKAAVSQVNVSFNEWRFS